MIDPNRFRLKKVISVLFIRNLKHKVRMSRMQPVNHDLKWNDRVIEIMEGSSQNNRVVKQKYIVREENSHKISNNVEIKCKNGTSNYLISYGYVGCMELFSSQL